MRVFYSFYFFTSRFLLLLFAVLWSYGLTYGQYTPSQNIEDTDILWHLPEDYNPGSGKKYPLLVYLHGSYNIINRDATEGIIKLHLDERMPQEYDRFIIVMPYLNRDKTIDKYNDQLWPVQLINEVIDSALVKYQDKIDLGRIYMTGISLGGKGTWDYAKAYPQRLAAIAPIAANSKLNDICNLKEVPVWALHGIDDLVVLPYGESTGENQEGRFGSIDAISALKVCGPVYAARLTLVDGLVHNGFDAYYNLSMGYNIYEWLLQFNKGTRENHPPLVDAGPDVKMVKPGHTVTISGNVYDPEGNTGIEWTRLSGPSVTPANQHDENLLLSDLHVGTYTFILAATDNNNLTSSDTVHIEILDALPSDNALTGITIHNLEAGRSAAMTNGLAVSTDIASQDLKKDAFYFTAATHGTVSRVRYSINQNRNQATASQWQRDQFSSASPLPKNKTDFSQHWAPQASGTYIVSATPFRGDTPGASVQYTITVTHDPLPVEFLDVTAQLVDQGVKVYWTTATETNNDFFTVERSKDMETFIPVGRLKGAGNSNSVMNYTYTDHFPLPGVTYYRIRQTDLNGRYDYSEIVSVHNKGIDSSPEMMVFPNPLKEGSLTVKLLGNVTQSGVAVQLIDALGRIQYSARADAASMATGFKVSLGHLVENGVYILRLQQDQYVVQKKIIIY